MDKGMRRPHRSRYARLAYTSKYAHFEVYPASRIAAGQKKER